MSHIVSIKTEIRDAAAIAAACQRLRLDPPVFGEAKLFSSTKTGWQVRLPDWRYPLVCDVATGQLDYDNYGERWGKQVELDRYLQAYAVEKAKLEARRKGMTCTEAQLTDGSIKLTINAGVAS